MTVYAEVFKYKLKAEKFLIFHRSYVKITVTCNYRNIFNGNTTNYQETEKLVFPEKRLGVVKNWKVLTNIGI